MRIAIVNDLALAREVLRRLILSVPGYTVAWVAEDGEQAVKMASQDRPDVILMDLQMPRMNGADATKQIMQVAPCPILIVTSSLSGNHDLVYRAMGYGGMDAVETPTFGPSGSILQGESITRRLEKIQASRASSPRHPAVLEKQAVNPMPSRLPSLPPIIAIGSSTGGPQALSVILSGMPKDLNIPIVIVQHIASSFATNLASWLNGFSKIPVRAVQAGDLLRKGEVAVAATDDHLILRPNHVWDYTPDPIAYPYRPSVNALFDSLAKFDSPNSIAVLLTGMGPDGADGLLKLRSQGWHTIAQNEASCVVYGMPRVAAEKNAAKEILAPESIATSILSRFRGVIRP
jgi:two-component system, chemotaxis family, response regulator WspF